MRDSSRNYYRKIVSKHLADWLDKPLTSITGDMVEARHGTIQAAVAERGHSTGHAMANMVLSTFGFVYGFIAEMAEQDGKPMPPNPVRRLKRQWFPVPRRKTLVRADQLATFYRAVLALPNAIHRDLILMLLFTGMRLGEAALLSWDEIDFGARAVRIAAGRMKAGRDFTLPMTDLVHQLLVARRAIGKAKHVFPSNGRMIDLRKSFAQIAATTEIDVSAHDLRRTFLTVAESTEISPLALKMLVAHATADVTEGYVMMSSTRLREAAQRVCDRLRELCEIAPVATDGNVARFQQHTVS